MKARPGARAADAAYEPTPGHYPQTSWPLEVIQIDHTPVDVIVVDQAHRRPIGRPYLTVAIDVHTRIVTGFLLSLEPPQATSVALCVAHAVLPKDDWLAKWRVDASWPGKPKNSIRDAVRKRTPSSLALRRAGMIDVDKPNP